MGSDRRRTVTFAAGERRVLFTFNTADYVEVHLNWLEQGQRHAGIILSNQLHLSHTTRRLPSVLNRVTADDLRGQILWLQGFKP